MCHKWVRALSDGPSSISGTHMVEERTELDTLSTDFHMCSMVPVHTQKRKEEWKWGGEKQRERGGEERGKKKGEEKRKKGETVKCVTQYRSVKGF